MEKMLLLIIFLVMEKHLKSIFKNYRFSSKTLDRRKFGVVLASYYPLDLIFICIFKFIFKFILSKFNLNFSGRI